MDQSALEKARMAMDIARRAGDKELYNMLRAQVDGLITSMQRTGSLGTVTLEDGTEDAPDLEGGK